jgi:hypothetical protein
VFNAPHWLHVVCGNFATNFTPNFTKQGYVDLRVPVVELPSDTPVERINPASTWDDSRNMGRP